MQEHQAELQRFTRDTQYYEAHQAELLDRYPEQWVAIFNEQVVGAAADVRRLLTELRQRNIPIEKTLVEHVTAKDELLILSV